MDNLALFPGLEAGMCFLHEFPAWRLEVAGSGSNYHVPLVFAARVRYQLTGKHHIVQCRRSKHKCKGQIVQPFLNLVALSFLTLSLLYLQNKLVSLISTVELAIKTIFPIIFFSQNQKPFTSFLNEKNLWKKYYSCIEITPNYISLTWKIPRFYFCICRNREQ